MSADSDYQTFVARAKEAQADFVAEESLDSAKDFQLEEAQAVMGDLLSLSDGSSN